VKPSRRWPGWVYGTGEEPDPRFSLANERTFLAWIRTSLAFLAAGVAVHAVPLGFPVAAQKALALLLVVLGIGAAVASWFRWAFAERAMRRGEPLPIGIPTVVVAVGLVAAGLMLFLVDL
jgi:putative membrane protein